MLRRSRDSRHSQVTRRRAIVRRMASTQPRLPQGLSPVQAGRLGLWLLGRRSHKAASLRIAFPQREPLRQSRLIARFKRLMTPWKVYEYPGADRFVAALLGISESYAHALSKPSTHVAAKHATRLAHYLQNHASQCDALAAELRAYAREQDNRKFANKDIVRRRG
jgi:hypothetical protein